MPVVVFFSRGPLFSLVMLASLAACSGSSLPTAPIVAAASPTATATTGSPTAAPTALPSILPSLTPTQTPSPVISAPSSGSPTPKATATQSPLPTSTPTASPTATPSATPTPTASPSPVPTATATALTSELIYVANGNAGRSDAVDVFRYTFATNTLASTGYISGSATGLNGNDPCGIAVDDVGNIYVSLDATATGTIYEYAAGSGSSGVSNVAPIRTIATTNAACGLWATGGLLYENGSVAGGFSNSQTQVFNSASNATPILTITATGTDSSIGGVTTDASGNIYVTSTGTNGSGQPAPYQGVYIYSNTGTVLGTITNGIKEPETLAFDPAANLYVNNYYSSYSPYTCCGLQDYAAGTLTTNPTPTMVFSNQQAGAGQSIVFDPMGNLITGTSASVVIYKPPFTATEAASATVGGITNNTFGIAVYPKH